jgi:hypothetical protein
LTLNQELVKILTSSEDETHGLEFKEVIKMMEFLLTMAVVALVFVAATIVVALVAGGLIKAKDVVRKRTPNNVGSE